MTTYSVTNENGARIIHIVPERTVIDPQTKHTRTAPAQYHCDRYYTQNPGYSLFKAMRHSIRKERTVCTLGNNCGLWEIEGNDLYVFITDKSYALRAQEILIKWISKKRPNFKYTAYHFCTDLENEKWRIKQHA
jgi:hypothetical protein